MVGATSHSAPPGRNVAILVEVAARNQLLRARGHHAARILADRLDRTLARAGEPVSSKPPAERGEPDARDENEDDEELEAGGGR